MLCLSHKRTKEITVPQRVENRYQRDGNPLFFQDRLLRETFQMESRGTG